MVKIPFSVYDIFAYIVAGFWPIFSVSLAFSMPVIPSAVGPVETFALISISYIVGHIVAAMSSQIFEQIIVHKLLQPPSRWLFEQKTGIPRYLFPGYFKVLSRSTSDRILAKAKGKGSPAYGEDLFSLARFDPAIRSDEKVMERLNIFLVQYGFARNMAMSGLLVCAVFIFGYSIQSCRIELFQYSGIAALLAIGMFYRFLKFYRQYSYELFSTWSQL